MSLSETKNLSLFATPMQFSVADLPHMAIEDYVRDRLDDFNHYTSFHDQRFNDSMSQGQPFRKEMEECMTKASTQFLESRGAPNEMMFGRVAYWYSVYNENDDHSLHCHPHSMAAGTYYPYADEDSAVIMYRHPAHVHVQLGDPWVPTHELQFQHQPDTGQMNVWPPWLEHMVKRQQRVPPERSRIAISWNYQ